MCEGFIPRFIYFTELRRTGLTHEPRSRVRLDKPNKTTELFQLFYSLNYLPSKLINENNHTSLSSSTITRGLTFLTIFLTFGFGSITTSSSTDTISF